MRTTDPLTAPLQDIRLLRIAEVSKIVGLCESRIRQLERQGLFPTRIAVGANSSAYLEGDLRRWLANRAATGKLRLAGALAGQQTFRTLTKKRAATKGG